MTGRQNDTIRAGSPASSAEDRAPAVLQVIPSLGSGGVERGTVEMAAALVAAGWKAYIASSGGPMERLLARVGAHHIALPLASKNPFIVRRNASVLKDILRKYQIDLVHARS